MFGAFSVYWEFTVVNGGGLLFAQLWGLPFVAMSLYTTERALIAGPRGLADMPLREAA